jgi:hypothetical protein
MAERWRNEHCGDGLRRFRLEKAAAIAIATIRIRALEKARDEDCQDNPTPAEAAQTFASPWFGGSTGAWKPGPWTGMAQFPGLPRRKRKTDEQISIERWRRYLETVEPGKWWAPPHEEDEWELNTEFARQCRRPEMEEAPGYRWAAQACGFTAFLARAPKAVDVSAYAQSGLALAKEACRKCAEHTRRGEETIAGLQSFEERHGKIRNATVHPFEVVQAARAISSYLLGRLRNVASNSRMLRNQRIQLFGALRSVAYSGDLSKGTDPISTSTARMVLNELLTATGAPNWMLDAVPAITGDMRLQNLSAGAEEFEDKKLTSGALMGLGPSWTIMSCLVAWAARRSGQPESYQINGDDIAALWPPAMCDRFESRIQRARLVCNKAKSFRGTGVVFCEQFGGELEQHYNGCSIRLRPYLRIGEASGVKSMDGERGHAVCDRLCDFAAGKVPENYGPTPKPLRFLARQTQLKFALGTPGRVQHGGGGSGRATRVTASSFLLGGRTSIATTKKSQQERLAKRDLHTEVQNRSTPTDGGGKPLHEVINQEVLAYNADAELNGAWKARCKAREVTRREHKKRTKCRHQEASRADPFELLRSERSRKIWNAKQRARAHLLFSKERWGAGIAYLTQHTRRISDEQRIPSRPNPNWLANVSRKVGAGALS